MLEKAGPLNPKQAPPDNGELPYAGALRVPFANQRVWDLPQSEPLEYRRLKSDAMIVKAVVGLHRLSREMRGLKIL